MATNIVCSNTGHTAHAYDGPYYAQPGHRFRNIVARCGKKVKVAVVITKAEAKGSGDRVESEYVLCDEPGCKEEW